MVRTVDALPRAAADAERLGFGGVELHGADGISTGPDFPNLNGQSGAAIYKQLNDYQTGSRVNLLMSGTLASESLPRSMNSLSVAS